jgi:GTPase
MYLCQHFEVLNFSFKFILRHDHSLCVALETSNSNWCEAQIVDQASKILMLIDTCGHPKYIRTTIQGLTGYTPDYACLVVDGQSSKLCSTTREVLGCAVVLNVPVFVVVTKVDLAGASENGQARLKTTLEALIQLLMLPGQRKMRMSNVIRFSLLIVWWADGNVAVVIQTEDDCIMASHNFATVVPIFLVSCVSGENLDLLINFFNLIPARGLLPTTCPVDSKSYEDLLTEDIEFQIEEVFSVPGTFGMISVYVYDRIVPLYVYIFILL